MLDLMSTPLLSLAFHARPEGERSTGPGADLSADGDLVGDVRLAPLPARSRARRSAGGPGFFTFTALMRDPGGSVLLIADKQRQSLLRKPFEVDVRSPDGRAVGAVRRAATRAGVTEFTGPGGERWAVAGVNGFRGWTATAPGDGSMLAEVELAEVAGRRRRRGGAPLRRYELSFADAASASLRALVVIDVVCTDLALFPRGSS